MKYCTSPLGSLGGIQLSSIPSVSTLVTVRFLGLLGPFASSNDHIRKFHIKRSMVYKYLSVKYN